MTSGPLLLLMPADRNYLTSSVNRIYHSQLYRTRSTHVENYPNRKFGNTQRHPFALHVELQVTNTKHGSGKLRSLVYIQASYWEYIWQTRDGDIGLQTSTHKPLNLKRLQAVCVLIYAKNFASYDVQALQADATRMRLLQKLSGTAKLPLTKMQMTIAQTTST
jgi:hypothetical protein